MQHDNLMLKNQRTRVQALYESWDFIISAVTAANALADRRLKPR